MVSKVSVSFLLLSVTCPSPNLLFCTVCILTNTSRIALSLSNRNREEGFTLDKREQTCQILQGSRPNILRVLRCFFYLLRGLLSLYEPSFIILEEMSIGTSKESGVEA